MDQKLCALSVLACISALSVTSGAQAQLTPAEPATLVAAFNETCRRGFPDLDAVGQQAVANGWVERSSRLITELSDPRLAKITPPRWYQKGDMMLSTMAANSISPRPSCGVATSGLQIPTPGALASAVSATLQAGEPLLVKDRERDRARWLLEGQFVVEASVQKRGRVRTANLTVKTAP